VLFWLIGVIAPATAQLLGLDDLLRRGQRLEHDRQWYQAVQLYEDATKSHPASSLLRERLRYCEIRYGLLRRYHDSSFRTKLLPLSRGRTQALYQEVLDKIDSGYYEQPDMAALFRAGLNDLLVAVEDDLFRRENLGAATPEQVEQLKQALRYWDTTRIRTAGDASRELAQVAAQCERAAGLRSAPVALEFTYGACEALDRYSAYLTPDRLHDLYALIDGSFVGLGVELRSDSEGLLILNVLRGGPAHDAGIRAADHIVAIDSVPVAGLTTEEAANRLQGAEGSPVHLWIRSPGESTARRLILRRRHVDVLSIPEQHMISPAEGIGYIQLTAFQKSTLQELDQAVDSLSRQGLTSLILDLRGNPGGVLSAAVEVADRFIADGVLVSTRGRAEGQTFTHWAQRAGTWGVPLVVLIDEDSASASEIVAGAIQDHRRGTLVGTRSYGKGTVQSILPLDSSDAGIRLTTAAFYSPRGRAYAGQGVSPEIVVARKPIPPTAARDGSLLRPEDPQLAAAIDACRKLTGRTASTR
jgi:carboxyl-terminal processing protease